MPISKQTQKWLAIAQEDLRDTKGLAEFKDRFLRFIVFGAQQSAEKSIKAYLAHVKSRFPNTHDIEDLLKLVAKNDHALAESLHEATHLTAYAIAFRYPDAATDELNLTLALKAVDIAERTLKIVFTALDES